VDYCSIYKKKTKKILRQYGVLGKKSNKIVKRTISICFYNLQNTIFKIKSILWQIKMYFRIQHGELSKRFIQVY